MGKSSFGQALNRVEIGLASGYQCVNLLSKAVAKVLRDPEAFSCYVIGKPLRPYQLDCARAIISSVLERKGLTITIEMARQGGKNELSAQVECYLLNLFQRVGGSIVKCAPTFKPQVIISKQRLEAALDNPWNRDKWSASLGYIVRLGKAQVVFFSADEEAHVVGATAQILMEFDEAQDIGIEKHDKDFAPMGATTNVTKVYYGTPWDNQTLLERVKQQNLELEGRDGIRRHFEYPWWVIAEYNPLYARYVETEQSRLGEDHPLFRTQYKLEPLGTTGGFLSQQQLAQLSGDHPRQHRPDEGRIYVAGVDIAGEEEQAQDEALRATKPRRDSTVVTIAEVDYTLLADLVMEPRLKIVEHYYWTGRRQRQQYEQLLDLLREVWCCRSVVVDASGVGAGVASFLHSALGERVCEPFVFTAQSKSQLGYDLLAAINSGRLKMYREAPSAASGQTLEQFHAYSEEAMEFWQECLQAKYEIRGNQLINFYVPERDGHDDFLMSLALCVRAASQLSPPPQAEIIQRPVEYRDGRF